MTPTFITAFRASRAFRSLILGILFASLSALLPAHADDYDDVSTLMRSGRMTDAMAQANKYLAARPQDPQMRFLKGMIQRETGKIDDAIATFTGLTQDYPELPEPHNNLAVLYASRNDIDKARAALEMAVRNNPDYATAHENLGDVYVRLAATAFARAQQLGGGNATLGPKLNLMQQLIGGTKAGTAAAVPPVRAVTPPTSPVPPTPSKGNAP
jgi:Flp pilus assembly protein TadD